MSMVDITPTEQRIAERVDSAITNNLAISDQAGGVHFTNAGQVTEFAKLMAVSTIGVRKHLRGNPGACLAIVVQAVEWGISAYAVANKSYLVNDQIAFESQLIQAVILKRAPIKGRIKFEFQGQGQNRICRAWARLKDDPDEIVEYVSPQFKDIQPKNSPLWKNDPDQQHCYMAGRALCRRHFPDVLLGIYDKDELDLTEPAIGADKARDVTPPKSLHGKLDALARTPVSELKPAQQHDPETGEVQGHGEFGLSNDDVQQGQDGPSSGGAEATKPDPAKIALLERLRRSAGKGSMSLRRAMSTASEAEVAMLTDADHDDLGEAADAADRAKEEV